jgi:WD40 repeat protein
MLGNPILSPAKILHFTINDNFAYLALSSHEAVKVDLKTNEIVMNYKGHKGPITSISTYSIGDKNFIITASWDKTLKKWCADSGNLLMTFYGHSDFVKCAKVFGAKLYSSSTDSIIGEWSLESGKCLRSFQGHRRSVEDLFITEDGKYIYSASSDNDILKWDIITGTSVQCFEGHLTSIRRILLLG